MIFTSYFANLRNIPSSVTPIAICGGIPSWFNGLHYKKLAPKIGFFNEWKKNHNNQYYIDHFQSEVLDNLHVETVIHEILTLGNYEDVVLVCYEKSNSFCHRHLVREWINSYYPFACKEWGMEDK